MPGNTSGRTSMHETASPAGSVGERVDRVLRAALDGWRDEMATLHPDAPGAIDEITRLVEAGGKRLRPVLCYWAYRAGGGPDGEPIVRAASAVELLHTMALVHDDLIDAAAERRGVEAVHVRLGRLAGSAASGRAGALLVGDLAAVLADRLLLESGFPPEELVRALGHYHRMRVAMAAGQWLELRGRPPRDREEVLSLATLRGGAYTVEGPLAIGASLADAPPPISRALGRFGGPLGQAFQLRDDLEDGDAIRLGIVAADVEALVEGAVGELGGVPPGPREALIVIARLIGGSTSRRVAVR